MHVFSAWPCVSFPAACLSTRSRMRGTRMGCVYTRRKFAPQPGSCGACSGRSKSRDLASNHGIAFCRIRATQDDGNPTFQRIFLHCSKTGSHAVTCFNLSPFFQPVTLTTMRVWKFVCLCVLGVLLYVRERVCVGLRVCVTLPSNCYRKKAVR